MKTKAMELAKRNVGQEVKGMGPRTQEAAPAKKVFAGTKNKNVKIIKGR